jgi:hypothetical protein
MPSGKTGKMKKIKSLSGKNQGIGFKKKISGKNPGISSGRPIILTTLDVNILLFV